ncbi:hypothetical protein [Flavobacterium urocaniciphilum]|uniref:Uncharacterized protein n=1 Tax=Flavobacterium urocaniciphilum TaxID=1299341 RepID=A0A1H8YSV2_9FLAO|nr:hypothetical protein [Flavobacterium urocaniciphilum]SEP55275.1 hypothetical protein SAMN05444005_101167 [Flavobacterium urocaniciphilum]
MAKLYSRRKKSKKEIKPNKEIVSFILSYSKALNIVKVNNFTFENVVN